MFVHYYRNFKKIPRQHTLTTGAKYGGIYGHHP
jgi:hypothetical protein